MYWDGDETSEHAESLLASFLQSLGGQCALPAVLPAVESLLGNSAADWKQQRAALAILEQCLCAAPATFKQHIPVSVASALRLTSSPSPRVQFKALSVLGLICEEDTGFAVRKQHGNQMVESICVLVNSPISKVSSQACSALVSFCRGGMASATDKEVRTEVVSTFTDQLVHLLVRGPLSLSVCDGRIVNNGALVTQAKAIGAIACLAEATGEGFAPFYELTVPALFSCTQLTINRYDVAQLRGSAVEAITIIGQSIGEDNQQCFLADAEKLMSILVPMLQQTEQEGREDVVPTEQILSACARIASVVEEKYAPFLGVVLPHLLGRLRRDNAVSISVSVLRTCCCLGFSLFSMSLYCDCSVLTNQTPWLFPCFCNLHRREPKRVWKPPNGVTFRLTVTKVRKKRKR